MQNEPVRLLMADNSSEYCYLLKSQLTRERGIEIVGLVHDGDQIVETFESANPDVVLLDMDLPKRNGTEAARAIRALDRLIPIIMSSSATASGGEATLHAIASGANDYVRKPATLINQENAIAHVNTQLLPKLVAWGERLRKMRPGTRVVSARPDFASFCIETDATVESTAGSAGSHRSATEPVPRAAMPSVATLDAPVDRLRAKQWELIVVAVSTGGPDALTEFLKEFPRGFSIPILIVQHMPVVFTRLLAERLDQISSLRVREADDGAELTAGDVWVAQGGKHLSVDRQHQTVSLAVIDGPPENSCRPAADVLFRNAAKLFGDRCLGVVLTGMGRDGFAGSQAIIDAGGVVYAQDQSSSAVWGMPSMVVEAGIASSVLPPRDLAAEIIRKSQSGS